jgi:NADH:ubiquinone oxidoreductase subunit K
MCSLFDRDSRELLVLAVALAVLLAQDQTDDEVGKMAAFFTIVGDVLALFALQPNLFRCSDSDESDDSDTDSG